MKHVVLVHGACHGAWCWYKVVTMLQRKGFTVTAVDLTSMGKNRANPDSVASLAEFAKPLSDYLQNVTDKVLLVGHSVGGITISYAMEQYRNKVEKAVFLASRMPLPVNNLSFLTYRPPNASTLPADWKKLNYANGRCSPPTSVEFNLKYVREFLYDDCPEEMFSLEASVHAENPNSHSFGFLRGFLFAVLEDVQLALSLLSRQPFAVYSEILTLTPEKYGSIPRFYILTSKDRLSPPSMQQMLVDTNPPEQVYTIDSGHSPFLSRPAELVSILDDISKL